MINAKTAKSSPCFQEQLVTKRRTITITDGNGLSWNQDWTSEARRSLTPKAVIKMFFKKFTLYMIWFFARYFSVFLCESNYLIPNLLQRAALGSHLTHQGTQQTFGHCLIILTNLFVQWCIYSHGHKSMAFYRIEILVWPMISKR